MKRKVIKVIIFLAISIFVFSDNKMNYDYSTEKTLRDSNYTDWIFGGKYPPIFQLDNDADFIESINLALKSINLPEIKRVVKEKEEITGSRWDRGIYEWPDYELGILQIERTTSSDKSFNYYNAIWKISLQTK